MQIFFYSALALLHSSHVFTSCDVIMYKTNFEFAVHATPLCIYVTYDDA